MGSNPTPAALRSGADRKRYRPASRGAPQGEHRGAPGDIVGAPASGEVRSGDACDPEGIRFIAWIKKRLTRNGAAVAPQIEWRVGGPPDGAQRQHLVLPAIRLPGHRLRPARLRPIQSAHHRVRPGSIRRRLGGTVQPPRPDRNRLVGLSMGSGEVARYLGTHGSARTPEAAVQGPVRPLRGFSHHLLRRRRTRPRADQRPGLAKRLHRGVGASPVASFACIDSRLTDFCGHLPDDPPHRCHRGPPARAHQRYGSATRRR